MKWIIDPVHSVAAFAVRHMAIAFVRGQFNQISGTVDFSPPDVSGLRVEAEVEAATLWTGIENRDAHLKSADFFYIDMHQKIRFKGDEAEALGDNKGRLPGDLTIRGITRPVVFEFEYAGPVKAIKGEVTSVGFTGSMKVKLGDFDMTWNVKMPEGGWMVGPEAFLTIDLEADFGPAPG